MQLMIDMAVESVAGLRLAAQFLLDHAAIIEGDTLTNVPAGTLPVVPVAPLAPPAPSNIVPFPPPPPPVVPVAANPAPSMGNGQTAPIAPPAPTATPSASISAPAVPAPPVPSMIPNSASPATTTTGVIERDSAGMPWDARIHQKGKSKKKDHTWKLQKGIDPAIVQGVLQDLQARGLMAPPVPNTPVPVGASAPVSLPPVPPAPGPNGAGAHFPPAPGQGEAPNNAPYSNGQAQNGYQAGQLPPPAPDQESGQASPVNLPPAAAVPLPPAASMGVPNANNAGVVQEVDTFRALVAKFTAARTSGKLNGDQVNAIVLQAGAPSLQVLKSMAHLIPVADALLDQALLIA